MRLPRISVVTPSYNQRDYVESTLRSVLDGGYPDLEYLVVDGGSTDGSAEVIERYRSRLAWAVSERDGGQYHAINKGFARSTGEVMAWLNSDDLYFPWTLRTVGELFARFPEVEWISGGVCYLNTAGQVIGTERLDGGLSREIAARGLYRQGVAGYLPQEGMFWRRSLWERSGARIDTTYRLAADYELWTRFAQHAAPVAAKCLVAAFRRHPGTQRSGRERTGYEAEVEQIAERLSRARWLWSRLGGNVGANMLLRLTLRGESQALEYDLARAEWMHRRSSRGRLYRPLIVRRKV